MNYYGKQQCLHMDWANVKVLTAQELAYCIHTYKITRDIPENRVDIVTKELLKLQHQDTLDQEHKLIEEIIGDKLDPTLFMTAWEAEVAIAELNTGWNTEIHKTEVLDHEYKNPDIYSRDVKALKKSMKNVKNKYIKLGGSKVEFDTFLEQLPLPKKTTLKQDIDLHRERITEEFVSIDVPATRAKQIAIAITTEIYFAIK